VIDLATDSSLLRRFVRDLDATSPRPRPAPPVLGDVTDADREAARFVWAGRIVDEYRSVAVFSELLGLLTDLEAPFAALCAVQRLIGDELRHTHLAATVVDWLGGSADLAIDLRDVGLPPRGSESPAVRALHIIQRELVVAEEESVHVLDAYRRASSDPAIVATFEVLLVDEVRHAAAGRALLALFHTGHLAAACASALPELAELAAADRGALRESYRATAVGGPGRALGASIELADLVYPATRLRRSCIEARQV
jgi:hypothetical protein